MHAFIIAVILGIVEGFTEFLPISSTGHLIIAQDALNFTDNHGLFTVVIQLGAIAAVIWYYRLDLWEKTLGLFQRDSDALRFWKLLVVATIPAGIFGLLLDKSMNKITTPLVVAISLILGGVVLWLVDRKPVSIRQAKKESVDFSQISTKRALLIGLAQCVAIIPGVSRSGATIVGGLSTGLNRPTATAFSFYLSIPVLVLASAYKLYKYGGELHTLPGGAGALLLGLAIAFVTALMAISWLIRYISRHSFRPFAYYRIGIGALILVLLAVGVL
jgi:undecaprenyl-diphosphatase